MHLKKRQVPTPKSHPRSDGCATLESPSRTTQQHQRSNGGDGKRKKWYRVGLLLTHRRITGTMLVFFLLGVATYTVITHQRQNVTISVQKSSHVAGHKTTSPLVRSQVPGNLYVCGWNTMAERIFPDFNFQGPWNPTTKNGSNSTTTTKNDVLVVGMYGKKCPGVKSSRPQDLMYEFGGKVLFVRAEPKFWTLQSSMPTKFYRRFYQMGAFEHDRDHPGPVQDANSATTVLRQWEKHTLQVFYVTFVILEQAYGTERWDWITNPARRPRNTGKFDGVAYFAVNCVAFRQEAAWNISTIAGLPIFHGEGCTVEGEANAKVVGSARSNYTQNYMLFQDFKWCLVMENTAMKGYVTEKLLNAFLGGCIPIFYGTTQVFEIFNAESFVFYDVNNPQPALEQLKRLKEDHLEYDRMMTATILANDNVIESFFSLFPEVGRGHLNQRIRDMMFLPELLGHPLK
jgi:Glycosyltransferase family 10 (fucosyltransferase) C-term